jgi:Ca-activated chloride channel family protein
MKPFSIVILMLFFSRALFAQDANSYIHQGNELYGLQKYKDAETDYRKAAGAKDQKIESNFNLGDALYKQKKFDDAAQGFTNIAASATDQTVKAEAYHNLGNSLLQSKKYDESIEAYKKSLLNNPKDDATRYNLAYAQEMLKKQQQQNKNNQNKNNQNKNNQNKDQNKQNPDKKNKDKNNQDKNNDQNKDQQNKNQQNQQQPDKISKDDAQRMLDALNNQEQGTQDKLKNKKLQGGKVHINKDW